MQYYGKFVPSLATLLNPPLSLHHKNVKWCWTEKCEKAFKEPRRHYFCHCLGSLWPQATPPSSLSFWCLCIWGGCSYFSCLLWWFWTTNCICLHLIQNWRKRLFLLCLVFENFISFSMRGNSPCTLTTCHSHPFWGQRRVSLHWQQPGYSVGLCYILSAYNYQIECKSTRDHGNANGLSRLPLSSTDSSSSSSIVSPYGKGFDTDIFVIWQIEALPVTAMQLKTATRCDPMTQYSVVFYIMQSMGGHRPAQSLSYMLKWARFWKWMCNVGS